MTEMMSTKGVSSQVIVGMSHAERPRVARIDVLLFVASYEYVLKKRSACNESCEIDRLTDSYDTRNVDEGSVVP